MQGDDHRVAEGIKDLGNEFLERILPGTDIDQHHVGTHALKLIQEVYKVGGDILVIDDHMEGHVSQTAVGLVAKFAIFDGQTDS
jgi:hypothetical protein